MLEPGLSDHSFASLLADPTSAMLTGDTPRITNGKKEESELMNGCDVARGGNRSGREGVGGGCGRDMSEHSHQHQQPGPHLPPPPLLPAAATTTNGGDKCEGSATPYALPSAPYTLPTNPPALFPPTVFPPHPQQPSSSEPRDVFSTPFSALTFPLQVLHTF